MKCFKHFMREMEQRFTSVQVVKLTGITPRQLQWWDERKVVVAEREGRKRLYSVEDLTEIAVICALRRKGVPLQRVRRIIKFLQKEFGRRLAEAVGNGLRVSARSEPDGVVEAVAYGHGVRSGSLHTP